jgi:hypothetical protein
MFSSGLKPFKCDVCERPFASRSNLKVHTSIHAHENKGFESQKVEKNNIEELSVQNYSNEKLNVEKCNVEKIQNRPHVCIDCGAEFRLKVRNMEALIDHS